jgi:endo-1,4-beta-xylanase
MLIAPMALLSSRSPLVAVSAGLAAAAFPGCVAATSVDDQGLTGGFSENGGALGGSGIGGNGLGGRGLGGSFISGGAPASGGRPSVGGALGGTPGNGGTSSGGALTSSGGATGGGSPSDGGAPSGGSNSCPTAPALTGGQRYCSNSKGSAGSGYAYELWAEGSGTGCMTVHGQEAAFSAEWNNVEDFLARVGLDFNQTQTHTQVGTISAEFAETKTETDTEGLTYIGIYGWTVNPLREFYILDDWGAEKPGGFSSDGTPRDEVGTLTADGETYDVWKKTRVNKPAITGPSETFDQYFSIRRTARQCGTISVSEHFTKWEDLGLSLGRLYEVKLLLEAQFNGGSIAFTKAKVVVE